MVKRDIAAGGRALQALFAGEDTEEGAAGGLLLAHAIIALINPEVKRGK